MNMMRETKQEMFKSGELREHLNSFKVQIKREMTKNRLENNRKIFKLPKIDPSDIEFHLPKIEKYVE